MVISRCLLIGVFCLLNGALSAQTDSIIHDGQVRTYLLHLPPSYDGSRPYPLVIAMHGGFGSAANLRRTSELSEKADASDFIVVYPEGVQSPAGIRTWNAGGCCGFARNNMVDDVGFISALIDTLAASYTIELSRIYATGISNGGMMAYRLACELSGRIAAIAPVAATMTAETCEPERAVPIVHFHSFLDSNVPHQGGVGDGVSGHHNPPLDSVSNVWAELNGCATLPDTVRNDSDLLHLRWRDCADDSELQLYLTHDGGHSWPGGKAPLLGDPDPPSEVLEANDLMWEFFESHALTTPTPVDQPTTVPTPSSVVLEQNYPNPFNPDTRIVFHLPGPVVVRLEIYDILGRRIRTLFRGRLAAGAHAVVWDGRDDSGKLVSAGVYVYRLQAGSWMEARKLLVLR